VVKKVITDNGGSALPDDFKLTLEGNPVLSGVTVAVNPGTHTAAETLLPGYTFTGFSGDCDSKGDVTVALGESKTCTLTNDDQQAYITVVKKVITDNGGSALPDDFKLTLEGNPVLSGVTVAVNPGTHTAAETLLPGYTFTGFSGDCDSKGDVTVALGESKTCTLTNDDIPPQLIVIKHVINGTVGTLSASDFTMDVAGTNVSDPSFPGVENPGTTVTLDAGRYEVTETGGAGAYISDFSADCVGTIAVGETKTCTVTNTRKSKVIVTKYNDIDGDGIRDPGESVLPGWTMLLTPNLQTFAPTPISVVTNALGQAVFDNLNSGPYLLSETQQPGWQLTGISCDDREEEFALTALLLDNVANSYPLRITSQQLINCEVGNQYQIPRLEISKSNNATGDKNGGDNVLYTITVRAFDSLAHDVLVTDVLPPGFTYRSGSWTASSSNGTDLKGNGTTSEPSYSPLGVWKLGDMAPGDIVTLTYLADISGSVLPGEYKDLAWAKGTDTQGGLVLAAAVDPGYLSENYVRTIVRIGGGSSVTGSYEVKVGGEVLGASTELPATGTPNGLTLLALAFILLGLTNLGFGLYFRRKHE
jgi:uncharacterized repeat protein (TIGR01451 family)